MGAIHVIFKGEKRPKDAASIDPCIGADGEWTSGNWVIDEEVAQAFVGHKLYIHRAQAKPSFFGGVILKATKIPGSGRPGRVIFRFRFDPSFRGVRTPQQGWAQEMKILWD